MEITQLNNRLIKRCLNTLLVLLTMIYSGNQFLYAQEDTEAEEEEKHELDRKGGFQDIKLNSNIEEYSGLEYKKDIKEDLYPGAKLYVSKKGSYTNIGKVEVHGVEVKVYKNQIYEIIVEMDKDPAIYQGLTRNFGDSKYNLVEKAYYWRTKNIRLYFKPRDRNRLVLEYYSYVMDRLRMQEIKQSYTDVSDDF